jgi:hypothetical protein
MRAISGSPNLSCIDAVAALAALGTFVATTIVALATWF